MVRQVMLEAANRQKVDVRRISFIDAWRWLPSVKPGDPYPNWSSIRTVQIGSDQESASGGPSNTSS